MKFNKLLLTSAILGVCATANAQSSDSWFTPKEVTFFGGLNINNTYKNKMIGIEYVPQKQLFKFADLLFNAEYHDSEYRHEPSNRYQGVPTHFSKTNNWVNGGIKLKKAFDNGIFLKAGVGVAYSHNRAYGRKISGSNWQFSPSYSVGYNVTKNVSVEYQWTHFSNAGTAPPNPGRDFHYIRLGYSFK